jgi:hypothetical protein
VYDNDTRWIIPPAFPADNYFHLIYLIELAKARQGNPLYVLCCGLQCTNDVQNSHPKDVIWLRDQGISLVDNTELETYGAGAAIYRMYWLGVARVPSAK